MRAAIARGSGRDSAVARRTIRGVRACGGSQAAPPEGGVRSVPTGVAPGYFACPRIPGLPGARGRSARKVRDLLRPRRVAAPRRPECVDVDPVARGLPGSRVPRNPRVPAKALAHGDVPPVPRVADRYPVGP